MGEYIMKRSKIALLALTVSILMTGCETSGNNPNNQAKNQTDNQENFQVKPVVLDNSQTTAADITAVSDANTQFAVDFYNLQMQKQDSASKNLFFSPYSLSTALAMTYEGATAETATQMAKVLHFPDKQVLARGNAGINNKINIIQTNYQLSTANALWVQEGFALKNGFKNRVSNFYNGKISLLDFITNPAAAAATINNSVARNTNNKIKNLVNENNVNSAKLVLTNAVYFKSAWENPFDDMLTQNAQFLLADGTQKTTPFMRKFNKRMPYFENDNVQMIKLHYKGGKLAMLVVLPKNNTTLDLQNLSTWRQQMQYNQVTVNLPKFKLETSYKLSDDLSNMGMARAFSNQAEFTEMSDVDLKINSVIHKAFIEVNEAGTEAAAATAVSIGVTSLPPADVIKKFNANHPFTILITHEETNNVLFMGHVSQPS